ncbi:hypothetical protein EMM73_13705 [Rheinheimera sediminis]|uniref:hypothetical protein n=1 Tax=Rheinheimera sp. YQF-1 TaxID=2499626 RepID=UPI000FD93AE6|nr:hypothetical protein [Rheinheimera sp. YQF-1]RVT45306.1 hypothetical protein EMM73_13705 [Rheinheimera sp. YQF-1]
MAIKAEVIDTNIIEIPKEVNFVSLEGPEILFCSDSILKIKSINLNSASSITSVDTDKYYTVFYIKFSSQNFLTLKCDTDAFLKYIKHSRLTPAPFEVKDKISGLTIIGAVFGVIAIFSILFGGDNSSDNSKTLSQNEMAKVCKAYIGEIFGKPTSIIENYKNQDGLTYVRYTRNADNTRWSYVCDMSNSSIAWAAWMSDTQEWGRWRYEDETKLSYDQSTNSISFVMNDTGSKVVVQL